jgi:WD40 repeat protein
VTTLPWEARCTAAGHGYVAVGGAEEGNFAAIKVAGFPPADPADVDALLPLHLASRSTIPRSPLLGAAHRIQLEKIGEDIVNSISIHKFPAEDDGEDEVVAVLTNNDKTVRVYSLTQNLEVAVLDLPFPMNHATISPDGQLLVAVGDHNSGFFFERVRTPKPSSMKTPEGRSQSLPLEWALHEEISLYVPKGSGIEGYFTTAWSPSGRLCAVGSECGYITIFDVELLKSCEYGQDAIVEVISSSRPDTTIGPGAVRTMQFSPAPWDFLVWSEDQARVCIADLRCGLKVKQTLTLDPKDKELEKVAIANFDLTLSPELQDLRREADFIRRYRRALDSEGTAAAVDFATDYIEHSNERRRLHRQLGVVESDNDPHGLTAHERQVLEALRTTRQREEIREQSTAPRSINYRATDTSLARRYGNTSLDLLPGTRNEHRHRERDTAARRDGTETLSELVSSYRPQVATLEHIQGRSSARRRASVVLSNESSSSVAANGNITDAATTRSPNPIPAHARRVDPQIVAATDDAWRTIEEALARNVRQTDDVRTSSSSSAAELQTELRRITQLTQMQTRLRNAREAQSIGTFDAPLMTSIGSGFRRASHAHTHHHDPSDGVRTAGLAMSPDGRTLYCGTEEGIFEFRINLHGRKGFPAISPR